MQASYFNKKVPSEEKSKSLQHYWISLVCNLGAIRLRRMPVDQKDLMLLSSFWDIREKTKPKETRTFLYFFMIKWKDLRQCRKYFHTALGLIVFVLYIKQWVLNNV